MFAEIFAAGYTGLVIIHELIHLIDLGLLGAALLLPNVARFGIAL